MYELKITFNSEQELLAYLAGRQNTPQPEPQPEEDYDAIRALIKEYEQRIDELEQMLPENQGQISGDENVNTPKPSEYVKI